jgi:carotenoid 1,2-hydratase
MDFGNLDQPRLERCLRAPGGFAWWYVDLVTDSGLGLVCLWSWGLPFLPDSRRPRPAASRPAVSLAVYDQHRPLCYLLQEHPPQKVCDVDVDGNAQIGDSTFRITREGSALRAQIDLDEPVPPGSERLRASITLTGNSPVLPEAPADSPHVWTPRVLHGQAEAQLEVGSRRLHLRGSAYFDGNAATVPLPEQGIDRWLWGRCSDAERTWVAYALEGARRQTLLLEANAAGQCRLLEPRLQWNADQSGLYGVRAPSSFVWQLEDGALNIPGLTAMEDGPFYRRFLFEGQRQQQGQAATSPVRGSFEVVQPSRLDLAWQRPFLRMRTHRVGEANSLWLPLFSGCNDDRLTRLLQRVPKMLRGVVDKAGSPPRSSGGLR